MVNGKRYRSLTKEMLGNPDVALGFYRIGEEEGYAPAINIVRNRDDIFYIEAGWLEKGEFVDRFAVSRARSIFSGVDMEWILRMELNPVGQEVLDDVNVLFNGVVVRPKPREVLQEA